MIYLDPKLGPAEADLLALEARRPGDADIAELIAAIRWMKGNDGGPGVARLKVEFDELRDERDDLEGEVSSLRVKVIDLEGENDRLRRKNEDLVDKIRELATAAGAS